MWGNPTLFHGNPTLFHRAKSVLATITECLCQSTDTFGSIRV